MTPLRRKLAIAAAVLLALVLVAGGVLAYVWNQATALPDWYTEGDLDDFSGEPSDSDGPPPRSQWIALDEQGNRLREPDAPPELVPGPSPLYLPEATRDDATARRTYDYAEAAPAPRVRPPRTGPKAKRHELRGFHRQVKGKPSPAVRASRAVFEDGRLEIGVILDLQQLPVEKLKPRDRARYERAVESFPGVLDRDVWVGVEDEPISVGGYLALSPEAEVRVGKLRYSLANAAKRMGMTPVELRLELNRELRRLGFVDPEA